VSIPLAELWRSATNLLQYAVYHEAFLNTLSESFVDAHRIQNSVLTTPRFFAGNSL
jgi:hypothetical protein